MSRSYKQATNLRRTASDEISLATDYVAEVTEYIEAIAGQRSEIATLHLIQSRATAAMFDAVHEAREHGWTWERIGDLLGTTKQAAQQRFSPSKAPKTDRQQLPIFPAGG